MHRTAAAASDDSPIRALPTPPVVGAGDAGDAGDAGNAGGAGGAGNAGDTAGTTMQAFYDSPICALPTPPACENFRAGAGARASAIYETEMSLAPCISEHERAQMERMEEASMHGYPRLGPPYNAYFQSYERAVYRLHTEGGELVAYAIVDTSRPRLLVMRIHELHVEQAWRRQTHATRLVHAIPPPVRRWLLPQVTPWLG